MSQPPDFGEGGPEERGTRRLALAIGAVIAAVVAILVIYAVVS